MIDFQEDVIRSSQDSAPAIVEQIFNNTGESGRFRIFRNRLLFLVANEAMLNRAIELARELRAVRNILKSPNRLEDLSESQQKQLKSKEGGLDLEVRIALTNTYRHLFYPSNDPVKAPKGLMHYTLPAQESSDVKGKNNQQETILKALKDCQKVRSEDDPKPYAAAYVLQKVWSPGLESITSKGLKEAFSKDLGLNLFVDHENENLRKTIRQGILDGQWDAKMGDRVYIKVGDAPVVPPETIEFSDRLVLYRRGILEIPKPREIQFDAQVMLSTQLNKPVRIRWKASGALNVKLYRDGQLIATNRLPSDEWEEEISQTVTYRVEADYGEGEKVAQETKARINYPTSGGVSSSVADQGFQGDLLKVKPEHFVENGSVNAVFNTLRDRIHDDKISAIERIELSVSEVIDYRRISTAIPILMRFTMEITQAVTMQTGDQFVRLEYQGDLKGFKSFSTPTEAFLANPDVRADVSLKIVFKFPVPVLPQGVEIKAIEQALKRNPVDRLHFTAKILY